MERGELWTLKDRNYASKTRPVVIVQANSESNFDSVILCLFTTFDSESRYIGRLTNDEMHLIAGRLAKILDIHKNDIEE
jgi:mRNA-degrading endonuclease toxin of MazEF toxin-antitoxin module